MRERCGLALMYISETCAEAGFLEDLILIFSDGGADRPRKNASSDSLACFCTDMVVRGST
jgi:hypothetical protein